MNRREHFLNGGSFSETMNATLAVVNGGLAPAGALLQRGVDQHRLGDQRDAEAGGDGGADLAGQRQQRRPGAPAVMDQRQRVARRDADRSAAQPSGDARLLDQAAPPPL